tara:strand:+ start:1070 stop:1240 length:171 start_codon:yes stop_codon:yes gene_type:complete
MEMSMKDVLKAVATLADKVGRYHERLLVIEREKEHLEKDFQEHLSGCKCKDSNTNK